MQQHHEPHDYSRQGILPVPAVRQIPLAIDEPDRIDKAHRHRVGQQRPREGAPAAAVAGTGGGGGPGVVLAAGPAERLQEEGGGDFNRLSSDHLIRSSKCNINRNNLTPRCRPAPNATSHPRGPRSRFAPAKYLN